jgi:pimeloyl-ACP methyl ester carboxylesterase
MDGGGSDMRMLSLERDGIRLRYSEHPGPLMPVVLIHGWCCDRSYFAPQFEHFARLGHRVIAVDLRGHGESDKPVQGYPMSAFSEDVAWMAGRLGIGKAVMIGHSMGGVIAYDLAGRYPDLVSAFVMIDATITRFPASRDAIAGIIRQLAQPDYGDVIRRYVEAALLLQTDDPVRSGAITAAMAAASQHVAIGAMEGLRDFDPRPLAGSIAVPALYIAANEMPPRTDMEQLRALLPHLVYGQTVGSGHFCQLEVPDQVNAMIDRFLALHLDSAGAKAG